jgi:hypothetical protein
MVSAQYIVTILVVDDHWVNVLYKVAKILQQEQDRYYKNFIKLQGDNRPGTRMNRR